ncbi:CARDB domain-containing protein [Leptospira adleri]|uniref:Cell adhesion protein n=1 Tax=Leptospira adleri TaxID=2023186 RepID=A0A2M9YSY2_9LEPT|nr:CARDB domain-containing protein [Leptospira adleri]PJZ54647.1 cell adhesion protein [Leptospira adleri]PJZ61542.1 cell adhesion protein [Leptospira adleri]
MTLDFRTKAKTILILITLLVFARCNQNSQSGEEMIPLLSLITNAGNTNGIEYETAVSGSNLDNPVQSEMILNPSFDPASSSGEGPDLIPTGITNFYTLPAGQTFLEGVFVMNYGNVAVKGNTTSQTGYKVDYLLSKNQQSNQEAPIRLGTLSVTKDLAPRQGEYQLERLQIPKSLSAGTYDLCAKVDPEEVVLESNENNNTFCVSMKITNPSLELLPDLVIPRASIYPSGMKCRAGKPMLFITAEVKNIGKAASPPALQVGLLNALDTRGEVWGVGNGVWGNGIGLESIQPGQTVTVTFPIYYLEKDPLFMEGPHTFDLRVNRGNWIQEMDIKNNGYKKSLEITIPEGYCKNHPG